MPKLSLERFERLIKQTRCCLEDLQGQLAASDPNTNEFIKTHLDANYQDFRSKVEKFEELDSLPAGLSDNMLIESVRSINNLYFAIGSQLKSIRDSIDIKRSSTLSQSNSRVVLPKLHVPKFSGQIEEFPAFISKFESIIHASTDLNTLEKMQYLFTLLDKDALYLVEHLPLVEANYQIALNLLKKRFHNFKRQITSHCEKLLSLDNLSARSTESIRKFLDTYNVHVNSLQSLQNVDVSTVFFVSFLLSKFDRVLAAKFEEQTSHTTEFPTTETILTFLENQAVQGENVQVMATISSPKPSRRSTESTSRSRSFSSLVTTSKSACMFCKGTSHKSTSCQNFLKLSPKGRLELVKKCHACINCLGPHFLQSCKSKFTCRMCEKQHHTLLHFDIPKTDHPASNIVSLYSPTPSRKSESHSSSQEEAKRAMSHAIQSTNSTLITGTPISSTVLLPTALVCLKVATSHIVVRAVLDTASHISFLSEKCAQILKCKRNKVPIPISGVGETPTNANGFCNLEITSLSGNVVSKSHPFFILKKITSNMPRFAIDPSIKIALSNKTLADPTFDVPAPIDALLGADLIGSIFLGTPYQPAAKLPFVIETIFGFVVMGSTLSSPKYFGRSSSSLSCLCSLNIAVENSLSDQLQKFWVCEEPPSPISMSDEDQYCENYFLSTKVRDCEGRYHVRLPFKPNIPIDLGNSYDFAKHCFTSLERKFVKNLEFKLKYVDFMKEYISLGHMKLLPSHVEAKYYIPHHGVFKTHGDTAKLRVVFNASAVTTSGQSLNSFLCAGPKLQTLITDIILRFRSFPIVFSCDIRQMYRQIGIHEEDQPFQCILWRDSPSKPIQTFMLTTITYGVASSPYLALRIIQQLIADEGMNFPIAATILQSNTFVDDIIAGAHTLNEAKSLKADLSKLLSRGGFELRKWSSNSPSLLDDICDDHQLLSSNEPLSKATTIPVLGLNWNSRTDNFVLNLPSSSVLSTPLTKRKLLSFIAQIFDPCGWLSPIVMTAKQLMQQIWLCSLDWDETLSPNIIPGLTAFVESLQAFTQFKFPRQLSVQSSKYQLHGFCDASQKGYAAVLYLRSESSNQSSSSLLLAKTRVAPLKTISLPRLELLGAYLLSQLVQICLDVYKSTSIVFDSIHLWCDSTIVLTWIQTPPYKLKTFIANRVAFIQGHAKPNWWRHVPSDQNIADIPSRGILPSQTDTLLCWFLGPKWLTQNSNFWPQDHKIPEIKPSMLELKSPTALIASTHLPRMDMFTHISSWPRVVRIICLILRACVPSVVSSPVQLYQRAEVALCRYIQAFSFPEALKALQTNQVCPKHIQKLSPFLDEHGLIRVGGRLIHSELAMSQRHPILLPKSYHLVSSLVDWYHIIYAHCGPSLLQSLLTQRYWILSSRSLVRSRTHKCIRCFRAKPTNTIPQMGNLPKDRVVPSPPFFNSGMDFAGPFLIRVDRLRKSIATKYYLCIFVCLATKAVHLEVAEDLSTPSFIDVLYRFTSRRGLPAKLYSDCGTNFVGASKELKRCLTKFFQDKDVQKTICDTTAPKGIEFHFNPPSTPHHNGLSESAVKSAKYHLKRVLGTHIPTLIQFSTLISRIEAILNSRPISSMSSDPNDLSYLTPAHFIIGRPLLMFPNSDFVHTPENRLKHFQLIQSLTSKFWKQWYRHYLPTLQARNKWYKPTSNIQIDDLVVVMEHNTPTLSWPVARVTKIFPGKDNVVRVAQIKSSRGQYVRPVTKLFKLP